MQKMMKNEKDHQRLFQFIVLFKHGIIWGLFLLFPSFTKRSVVKLICVLE